MSQLCQCWGDHDPANHRSICQGNQTHTLSGNSGQQKTASNKLIDVVPFWALERVHEFHGLKIGSEIKACCAYSIYTYVFSIYIYFMGRLDRFRRNTDCDLRIILSRSTLQSFNVDPAK